MLTKTDGSWKDNRRFRCVVVRSIEMDMIVSHFNNNYQCDIFQTKQVVKHTGFLEAFLLVCRRGSTVEQHTWYNGVTGKHRDS